MHQVHNYSPPPKAYNYKLCIGPEEFSRIQETLNSYELICPNCSNKEFFMPKEFFGYQMVQELIDINYIFTSKDTPRIAFAHKNHLACPMVIVYVYPEYFKGKDDVE